MANNYIEVNVNHDVWIKLTDAGKAEHRQQHDTFMKEWAKLDVDYRQPEEVDGWSRWQLWELMRIFGSKFYNGCDVPFETTIRIETDGV